MLFQTQIYILAFLPVAVLSYHLVSKSPAARQWVLLLFSVIFYGWWDVRFVPLLIGQVSITWLLSLWHDRSHHSAILYFGIVLNLCSLATFKYLAFILTSFEAASGVLLPRSDIVLPIGISFFSFQLISYLVDRLRHDASVYPLRQFALFVMFFPHLIAGPIVRHNELIPQFDRAPRGPDFWPHIGAGFIIFTMGFAKKVLLADQIALVADPLFLKSESAMLTFGEAWTAVGGFSLQLFLDFSAYTEMAIGSALMFNLVLPENFRRPYLATDLRDFWQRWHITLSKFIRDYIYIPLGGSHGGVATYLFATLFSMSICGLWHGAAWTFVAWGFWHGIGLVICRGWKSLARPMPAAAGWLITMLFVTIGWVLFRSHSFGSALSMLQAMTQPAWPGMPAGPAVPILFAMSALASVALPSAHELKDGLLRPRPVIAAGFAVLAALGVVWVGTGAPAAFIYFQF